MAKVMERYLSFLESNLSEIRTQGLYKEEHPMVSLQGAKVQVGNRWILNLCANNYLGLSGDPRLIEWAREALGQYGFGLSSVRFICGTQQIHKQLEVRMSRFLQKEDTILYSSCFDANGGLFETLLGEEDAVISDSLNHASIIDGIRLSKAKRFRFDNNNMNDLEEKLKEAHNARFKLIATDGVFSMDGIIANLSAICDLADRYDAMVMVDDSHAVGFMGAKGRGSPEHCGVMKRVHLLTGTLGKALGGASGGYISGPAKVVEWLRQRSRPYLFSNTLAPVIVAVSLKVVDWVEEGDELRQKLKENSQFFRRGLSELGFKLVPGEHPIIPVMLGDARIASEFSKKLFERGIYAVGFSFPVVPKGLARIRTQMSAAHSKEDLKEAIDAFAKVGKELGVI